MATFLLPGAPIDSLERYLETDVGGRGVARAQQLGPAETRAEVAAAGLRGRGGGGFPTGRKWETIAAGEGRRFAVCNGAEGEPGTFKDRALMRSNPYQLVEGVIIATFAVGAERAYICIKEQYTEERRRVTQAVEDLQRAGICTDCEVVIVAGPDEYLFGEEKALLEVIEGNSPLPRLFPPHEHGLFATTPATGWETSPTPRATSGAQSNPTLVNNVETLSNVTHILARGAEWFRTMGTDASPGTIVATVVGDVVAPDVGEVELGVSLGDLIHAVGSGVPPGRSVKAILSGVANPVLTSASLDAPVTYEGLGAAGSGLGSAGFIVLDDTACMVQAALNCSRFLYVESCGQCPPCKRGSMEITQRLERIEAGVGTDADLDEIAHWLGRVTDANRCFLGTEERQVVTSILQAFPDEVSEHLTAGRCPRRRRLPIWKLRDLRDGVATYDESFWRKQPDWTYAPS